MKGRWERGAEVSELVRNAVWKHECPMHPRQAHQGTPLAPAPAGPSRVQRSGWARDGRREGEGECRGDWRWGEGGGAELISGVCRGGDASRGRVGGGGERGGVGGRERGGTT